jgi:hypothetical protein
MENEGVSISVVGKDGFAALDQDEIDALLVLIKDGEAVGDVAMDTN